MRAQGALHADVDVDVAFHDVDMVCVVWHGHYVRYLENARWALMNRIGYGLERMLGSGFAWPIIELHTRYVNTARFGEQLRVRASLVEWEGDHIPSIVSLDSEYRGPNGGHYSGNVIYLSTFSKLLAPGLRLAWVVAPPEVIRKFVMTKQAADLHTASFNQYVAYEVGKGGFLDEHVKVIRATYKERRDVMIEMMEEMFPAGVRWSHPKGGMFLWGILPEGMDSAEVLKRAVEK